MTASNTTFYLYILGELVLQIGESIVIRIMRSDSNNIFPIAIRFDGHLLCFVSILIIKTDEKIKTLLGVIRNDAHFCYYHYCLPKSIQTLEALFFPNSSAVQVNSK